ncbi:T9SS type A sorting domain-containing protein [Dyadobacter beijingensis]|nr:T9SS type A sorting domain-containing protein [Dyadobacter beijingensis]
MKQPLLLLMALASLPVTAQFSAGAEGFHITGDTPVVIDSLTLTPSSDLTISNRSLSLSYVPIPGTPTASIERVYTFDTPLNFTGLLGIIYDPSTELNGNSESILEISYSASDNGVFTVTSGSARNLVGHHVSQMLSAQNLSSITATNSAGALPVTLVDFHAKNEGKTALLTWTTASETNSGTFEILRSRDARDWQVIGQMVAQGESHSRKTYFFTDPSPESDNYYRLKMVDLDGSYALTAIRRLAFEDVALNVFPNPSTDKVTVRINDLAKVKSVELADTRGTTLRSLPVSVVNQSVEFDLKHLTPGTYIVKVYHHDGTFRTLKIVRQ